GSVVRYSGCSSGKNPTYCHCRWFVRHHTDRAGSRRRCAHLRRRSCYVTTLKRSCLVCQIPAANFLAEQSGCLLPIPVDGNPALANHRRGVVTDRNYRVLCFAVENSAIPHRRLALVSGNPDPGDWICSGWRANDGGPLLLYSVDWFVYCDRVWSSEYRA